AYERIKEFENELVSSNSQLNLFDSDSKSAFMAEAIDGISVMKKLLLNHRALFYFKWDMAQHGLNDYTELINLFPDSSDSFYCRGTMLSAFGRYEEALIDLNKAIELDPKNADAYYYRGLTHQYMNNTELSEKDFKKAIIFGSELITKQSNNN
ncbi:MAG TPA: tetratricopeptide repeat protein, partial [Bacteroidales bacterium]|nr:tetratricopeptide repeat protein [Bacteroidales bacterium]